MSLMNPEAIKAHFGALRDIGASLVKEAGDAKKVHALSGRLYLSSSGWLLLTVPNALVRGAFDSLHVPGVELPLKNGRLVAHISVMDADEVESIGGPTAISERGHQFSFNLGALKEVEPKTWDGVSKVWYLTVDSPELRQLRRSYGLEPLRNGYDHHVTVAIRKTGVLNANEKTKSAGWANSAVYSARLQGHRNAQQLAGDARTLLSEKTSAIQGLRKAWYSCLSSLAPEFSKLSCRHGPATSRDVVGSCEQCEGLLSDELYLGYEKAAESQSAVVSLHTTGRPAVNASRMGGTHGCEVAYDCRENRPVRLDDSASLDNGVKQSAEGPNPLVFLNMLDDVVMYHMARHRMQQARQQAALATPPPPKPAGLAAPATVQPTTDNQKTATALDDLREAKARSDKRDYAGKTHILRRMMKEKPHDWAVDSEDKGIAGLTHMPTKFRLHLPSHHIHDLRKGFGSLAKKAGMWEAGAPDVVKLPLRGGEQSICPRCHKPIVHGLYRDKKGWTFHRSCFGKGKGPVVDNEKVAISTGLVERALEAWRARAATGDPGALLRAERLEATKQKWLVGKAQAMQADGLPGGHLGRIMRDVGRGKPQGLSEAVNTLGAAAGTDHKRLAISKNLVNADGLKSVGFENGNIAVPETGQEGFHNLRHVQNNLHWHPHENFWTVHEDSHPSIPMAVRNAVGPKNKVQAFGHGMRHVIEEGVPGWYQYIRNKIDGGRPILHAIDAEKPSAIVQGETPQPVPHWQPSLLRKFGPRAAIGVGAGVGAGVAINNLANEKS